MKKSFAWAVLCAAIMSFAGTLRADTFDVASDESAANLCDSGCGYDDCPTCDCLGNWVDNTYAWAGGDIYKSIGDRVTNIAGGPGALTSSFGTVAGFNTGFGLGDSRVRGQVGASYGLYDFRGRLAVVPVSDPMEEQTFVTGGIYKRGDMLSDCDPVSWGVVLDAFHASQWGVNASTVNVGQVRGVFGYALSECTEVGTWATFRLYHDNAQVTVAGGGPFRQIHAMNQVNFYAKRNFEFGSQMTAYVGAVDNASVGAWQFGVLGQAPLSYNWSMYGNFTYVVPGAPPGAGGSGEEQYNMSFGLAYYFGGKAVSPTITSNQGLPLLNVANNGSFLITD